MRVPQERLAALARSKERRRFRRVRTDLAGRYLLADGREYPCQVVDMSAGGLALTAPARARSGSALSSILTTSGALKV